MDASACDVNDGAAFVVASGGASPYTYLWDDANTQTTSTAGQLTAGTYTVIVIDANGCTATTSITIGPTSSLNDIIDVTLPTQTGPAVIDNVNHTATP